MPKTIITILGTSGAKFNRENCTPQTHDDGSIKYQSARYESEIFGMESKEYRNSTHFMLENFDAQFICIGTQCAIDFQQTILHESMQGKRIEYITIGDNTLDDIFEAVLELLQHHDDVMLDITHGYRHQPIMAIYASTLSQFLQRNTLQIVFAKELKMHEIYEYVYLDSYIEITQISLLLTGFIRTLNFIPIAGITLLDTKVFENFSKSLSANDLRGVEKHYALLKQELERLDGRSEVSHLGNLLNQVRDELRELDTFSDKPKHEKYLSLSKLTVNKNYLIVSLAYLFESLRVYSALCFQEACKTIRYKNDFAKKQDIMNAITNPYRHNGRDENSIYATHFGFYKNNKQKLDRVAKVYREIRTLRNDLAHINEEKEFNDIKQLVYRHIFMIEGVFRDNVLGGLKV